MPKVKPDDQPSAPENAANAQRVPENASVPDFEPLEPAEATEDTGDASVSDAPPITVVATKRCYGRCDELGLHIPSGYIDIEILSDGRARIV